MEWILWLRGIPGIPFLVANCWKALWIGSSLFLLIFGIERYYGASTDHYRKRSFLHDALYFIYFRGLHKLISSVAFYSLVAPYFAVFRMDLLGASAATPYLALVTADFMYYWNHRWQHANRLLWAFHTTHHSAEDLSFATQLRFHPVGSFLADVTLFLPVLVLGSGSSRIWLPLLIVRECLTALQHSHIPWTFGPAYYVFCSPVFHSYHHSTNPAHYGKNFGVLLSCWDFLFGTALVATERAAESGLPDVKMPTLRSQLLLPFEMVYDTYIRKRPMAGIVPQTSLGRLTRTSQPRH